jgi:hypothetical protein
VCGQASKRGFPTSVTHFNGAFIMYKEKDIRHLYVQFAKTMRMDVITADNLKQIFTKYVHDQDMDLDLIDMFSESLNATGCESFDYMAVRKFLEGPKYIVLPCGVLLNDYDYDLRNASIEDGKVVVDGQPLVDIMRKRMFSRKYLFFKDGNELNYRRENLRWASDCIPLTATIYTLISPEDWGALGYSNWSLNRSGNNSYAMRRDTDGESIYLHKEVAERMGLRGRVAHKNGDTLDNRRENLCLSGLSDQAIAEIRELSKHLRQIDIAVLYGVSQSKISSVLRG